MARAIERLNALKIAKAQRPGMYADGGGLYLRVTNEGAKGWVFRFMLNRRARDMGLGPLALIGLNEARKKALDARRLHHERIDPIEARRTPRRLMAASDAFCRSTTAGKDKVRRARRQVPGQRSPPPDA